MKKVISIFVLALVLISFSCKKTSKTSQTPSNVEVFCVYIVNTNGTKTFDVCTNTLDAAQHECVELRNAGKEGTYIRKSQCSDC